MRRCAILSLALTCACAPSDHPEPDMPITIAHRGASGYAPEHTIRAYELALEMGADYIEQDLQLTADGVLVVLHDATLDRTVRGPSPACSGPVIERTLDELASCEAGSWFNEAHPEFADDTFAELRIPTLREVFERFGRGTRYYIETKNPEEAPGMEQALLAELGTAGLLPEDASDWTVLIQSFSENSLRAIHELNPRLPLVQLIGGREAPSRDRLIDIATYAVGIGPNRRFVDTTLIDRAHAVGLVVHPYTVNTEGDMTAMLDAGVDGVFTDFPDRFNRVKERQE